MTLQGLEILTRSTRLGYAFKRRAQRGFSLMLALIFVTVFAGALAAIATFNSYEIRQNEARVTGAEMLQIAKAARLFTRNLMAKNTNLRSLVVGYTGNPLPALTVNNELSNVLVSAQTIPLQLLKDAGFLPQNFGRSNGTTALGQKIYVVLTNWKMGTVQPDTVPTAFIYIDKSSKSTPLLMQVAVEVARKQGLSITAPRFEGATNKSAPCSRDTSPNNASGLWDTGCLTNAEFDALMDVISGPGTYTLQAGAIMVPAWKTIQPDLRAVMRYPQPENPGFATMLTDLQMGTPVGTGNCATAAHLEITTTDSAGNPKYDTDSGVCDVEPDGVSGTTASRDKRFNVLGVANMALQRVIAAPQNTTQLANLADTRMDGLLEEASAGLAGADNRDEALQIAGDVELGSDLRIYDRSYASGAAPSRRFDVPNGTVVVERNVYVYSQKTNGKADVTANSTEAKNLIATSLTTKEFEALNDAGTNTASLNASSNVTLEGILTVGTGGELITKTLEASKLSTPSTGVAVREGKKLEVSGAAQIGTLDVGGWKTRIQNNTLVPGSTYHASIGTLKTADKVVVTDTLTTIDKPSGAPSYQTNIIAGTTTDYNGDKMNQIEVINKDGTGAARCAPGSSDVVNACPKRGYHPPSVSLPPS